jgi:hypothetical protein
MRAAVHEVDSGRSLQAGGVFASIRDDRDVSQAVAVDREFGTIVWLGDVDLDPDVRPEDQAPASGPARPRRGLPTWALRVSGQPPICRGSPGYRGIRDKGDRHVLTATPATRTLGADRCGRS